MKDELLNHLHDDHLLVPNEHLLHEYDFIYNELAFIGFYINIWLYDIKKCPIHFDLIGELKICNYFHFAFIAEYLSHKW